MEPPRLPLPPFDATMAADKVRIAEDAWNSATRPTH
jgi:nuclear transport factor 2 (NTF2) superfamily protein